MTDTETEIVRVTRREWLFPLLLGVGVFLFGSLPYLYGYYAVPDGQVFMGFVGRGTPGANGYLAFARQVQQGNTLIQNIMTPEPTNRDYFNAEWWVFGQLSRQLGLSLIAVFHLTRALIVLFYALSVYWFFSLFVSSVYVRRLGVALVCLGSGLGWLVWCANHFGGLSLELSRDLRGVSIPAYLVNKPHFILAAAFATLTQGWHFLAYRRGNAKYFAYSGLAAAAHSLVRPYAIPETHVLWVLFPALLCLRDRAFSLARFKGAAIAIAVHAPVLLYFAYYAFTGSLGHPDWSRPSPHLLEIVLWMGLPMLAFVVGLPAYLRMRGVPTGNVFLTAWILIAWLHCALHPYTKGGQESAYYSYSLVPVVLTLSAGLPWLYAYLQSAWPVIAAKLPDFHVPRVRHASTAVLMVISVPSFAIVYEDFFTTLYRGTNDWTFCISRDLYDGLSWLDEQTTGDDVVMASFNTSQFVWRLSGAKTVTGHDFLTTAFYEKNGIVDRFYRQAGDLDFKRATISQQHVHWVVYGEFEKQLGPISNLEGLPFLKPAFQQGGVVIFAVAN